MIIDRPESHFIFVLPWAHVHMEYNYINFNGTPLTNREYLDSWGKWILFGTREEFDALVENLDPFVEQKVIPAIKYDRKPIAEFGLGKCVMCIFCHVEKKEAVWKILLSQGVENENRAWIFERETVAMWQPGGRLLESWISGNGLSQEQADKMRENAKEKFKRMFEDENAIFKGIDQ
ncbi:MAG: hypothetical protein RBT11_05815 [Desulfobacterales bacterium]|jgi:hypothetical protein|nr:hypothetical protein [Desulfobacterales bacterium]